jgi:hypothetical protein
LPSDSAIFHSAFKVWNFQLNSSPTHPPGWHPSLCAGTGMGAFFIDFKVSASAEHL